MINKKRLNFFLANPSQKILKIYLFKWDENHLYKFSNISPPPKKKPKPPTTNIKNIIILQFKQNGEKVDFQQFHKKLTNQKIKT